MERITTADVERIAATISESLKYDLHLFVQGRNGQTAVDLCDDSGAIDLLHVGTKREVYTYLQGMRRALLITNRLER
jgi:hypothetical protein